MVLNVKAADLSEEAFKRFRKEAAESGRVDKEVLEDSNEMLLTNLLLVDENTGQLKRSAAMLFHPNPERFVSGAYIKLGFFAGEDDDLVFQDEVHGPLMLQVDEVIRLLEEGAEDDWCEQAHSDTFVTEVGCFARAGWTWSGCLLPN